MLRRASLTTLLCLALFGVGAGTVAAGGFEFPYQAAKPAGMGGAFVGRADDPSALFYNPGGVALLEEKPAITAGLSIYSNNQSLYQGLAPGVGAGTTGEQETRITPVPHVYWVKGVGNRLKVGAGLTSPFLWQTRWANPASFSGRGISLEFELTTLDLAPGVALQVTPSLGVGVSAVYRLSEIKYVRREQTIDPLSGELVDFAGHSIATPMQGGFGINGGVLYRIGTRVSFGFTFRSPIEIDFTGSGTLTQIPTGNEALDALLQVTTPFDQELGMSTGVEFPGQAVAGVAIRLPGNVLLVADFVETAWSSVDRLSFRFPTEPSLSDDLVLELSDTATLRVGASLRTKSGTEFRAGYSFEQSPQPDRTVGPLLPDADRNVFSFGIGKDWLDLSFVWVDFGRRNITQSRDDFNGNFSSNAWLLGLTVSK